jgi:hypothetical protein
MKDDFGDLQELLSARVDGQLTPEEARRVQEWLAANDGARAELDRIERVSRLVGDLGPVEPPPFFASRILASIERPPTGWRSRLTALFADGGTVMTRKALWGVAGVAAIALGVFAVRGFPPVDRGAEGTIGAAQRAQTPQLSDKDVILGDAEGQAFMQSEIFDLLIKDEAARKILADAELRNALRDGAVSRAIADADLRSLMRHPAVRRALEDPAMRRALEDPELRRALESAELRRVIDDLAAKKTLEDSAARNKALEDLSAKKKILDDAAATSVRRALDDAGVRGALRNDAVRRALDDAQVRNALRNDLVRRAVDDAAVRRMLDDSNFDAALRGKALESALRHPGFSAALRMKQFEMELAGRK